MISKKNIENPKKYYIQKKIEYKKIEYKKIVY